MNNEKEILNIALRAGHYRICSSCHTSSLDDTCPTCGHGAWKIEDADKNWEVFAEQEDKDLISALNRADKCKAKRAMRISYHDLTLILEKAHLADLPKDAKIIYCYNGYNDIVIIVESWSFQGEKAWIGKKPAERKGD